MSYTDTNSDDIVETYKPLFIKNNRYYKSNTKSCEQIIEYQPLELSPLNESLLNPFDMIDSKYFNISHQIKQAPLITNMNNHIFTTYMILHQIITKYTINTIYLDDTSDIIKNNINFKNIIIKSNQNIITENSETNIFEYKEIETEINEQIKENRSTIYCVELEQILDPFFWKNKSGCTIVIRVNPLNHTILLLNILDNILDLSNKSYIEIPINHTSVYYIVAVQIHHNFHQLYINLKKYKNLENNISKYNIIFNRVIQDMQSLNKRKNKYSQYTWHNDSAEYVMALNLNYCYSVCKKYQLDINPLYLNSFNQLREIKLKHSKYISKYFPYQSNIDITKLQITNIGLYSITKPCVTCYIGDLIQKQVKLKLNKNLDETIITDGTGGVGGDAIMFTKFFKHSNIVEIVKIHYDIIMNNLNVYNRDKFTVHHNNYIDIFDKLTQDVIYLDSPWGGIGYKEQKYTELYLFGSDVSFNNFIERISIANQNKCLIFVKCPINYNIFQLSKNMNNIKGNIEVFNVANFLLLCLSFNDF